MNVFDMKTVWAMIDSAITAKEKEAATSGRGPENRKEVLTMNEYIENPLSGKLRGVTYEDGKIINVHIRDTDDVVKVFVPVRHGRWIEKDKYTFGTFYDCSICGNRILNNGHSWNYCPNCGCLMDGGAD